MRFIYKGSFLKPPKNFGKHNDPAKCNIISQVKKQVVWSDFCLNLVLKGLCCDAVN